MNRIDPSEEIKASDFPEPESQKQIRELLNTVVGLNERGELTSLTVVAELAKENAMFYGCTAPEKLYAVVGYMMVRAIDKALQTEFETSQDADDKEDDDGNLEPAAE